MSARNILKSGKGYEIAQGRSACGFCGERPLTVATSKRFGGVICIQCARNVVRKFRLNAEVVRAFEAEEKGRGQQ